MMGCNDFLDGTCESNFSNGNTVKDTLMLRGGSGKCLGVKMTIFLTSLAQKKDHSVNGSRGEDTISVLFLVWFIGVVNTTIPLP